MLLGFWNADTLIFYYQDKIIPFFAINEFYGSVFIRLFNGI